MQKQALGKGLGALIPGLSQLDDAGRKAHGIHDIELDKIIPNEHQPRKYFDEDKLRELADSIREHGIIEPLVVHKVGTGYQIIVGERRWRAARMAGLKAVPALVKDATRRASMEMALIENIQREDLNPLETAEAYKRLQDEFEMTQDELAKRVGKMRSTVTNYLRVLHLPREVQQGIRSGALSMGHAKALLSLERGRDQIAAAARMTKLSVRAAEALVARLKHPAPRAVKKEQSLDLQAVEERLKKSLGTKVSIAAGAKGGKIVIEYYSMEELDRLLERLG